MTTDTFPDIHPRFTKLPKIRQRISGSITVNVYLIEFLPEVEYRCKFTSPFIFIKFVGTYRWSHHHFQLRNHLVEKQRSWKCKVASRIISLPFLMGEYTYQSLRCMKGDWIRVYQGQITSNFRYRYRRLTSFDPSCKLEPNLLVELELISVLASSSKKSLYWIRISRVFY